MRWTALFACCALAACAGNSHQPLNQAATQSQPVDLSKEQRADVEEGVRRGLKDPNSAMFGSMSAVKSLEYADTLVVCGYVNSKNSYGGYVGDQPFLAMYSIQLKTATLIGVGGVKARTSAVRQRCGHYGIAI